MSNLAGKPPLGQKQPKPDKDPDRLVAVRALPCCICAIHGLPQLSPTTAHHCIMGRYSTRKASDSMTIPLCDGHHQGMFDTSKIAIHQNRAEWEKLYGQDTDYLEWTDRQLNP